jgi:hypothetical protein
MAAALADICAESGATRAASPCCHARKIFA